ncbi:MAG: hypothetical protein JW751_31105 [Polyangiaceae bacterium]|nr:hypothetical protein [Polyangiaceae bacterium]
MEPPDDAPPAAHDPVHWVQRHRAEERPAAASSEPMRTTSAFGGRDTRAKLAGAKRAAQMAASAGLAVRLGEAWGNTHVEHLGALAEEPEVPGEGFAAVAKVIAVPRPTSRLVSRGRHPGDERWVEGTRAVMAQDGAAVHGPQARGHT